MIVQGVKQTIRPLEVGDTPGPKKGGMWHLPIYAGLPGCDLTTSDFQVSLSSLHNGNFGAFGRPMAQATWARRPLRGSPWVFRYPYCHQMITQTHPKGDERVSEKVKIFQVPLNSLSSVKTAESSPARGQKGGGPGVPRVWTQGPCHGLGVHIQKNCSGHGSKSTHSGRNTQRNCDPPPTHTPKRGYPGTGA